VLAVGLVAKVLGELVPRDDLTLVGSDPRKKVFMVSVEIERRWRTLELAGGDLTDGTA
jgi:hypothetical protein